MNIKPPVMLALLASMLIYTTHGVALQTDSMPAEKVPKYMSENSSVTTDGSQPEIDKQAIKEVIWKMNKGVTERNIAHVTDTFAEHAIKVDLFPAHYKSRYISQAVKDKQSKVVFPKTASLATRWQAVLGIMSGSTKLYERSVKDMQIHVDGAMANAWVHIHTRTVSHDPKKPESNNDFYEIVLLKKIAGEWSIMLTSNNRHDQ